MNFNNINIQFEIGSISIKVSSISTGILDTYIPRHSHSLRSYEIHYITTGFGKLVLDDSSYELKPNDLYTTGPHISHQQIPLSDTPMSEYCILLEVSPKLDKLDYPPELDSVTSFFINTPFWLGQDYQHIGLLFEKICYELEHQYLGYYLHVQSLFQQLIVSMVRNYQKNLISNTPLPSKSLNDKRLIIIDRSFLNDYSYITASLLAERLGLSTRQMGRILQDYYHMSFNAKKLEARMSAALSLLESSTEDVESIALSVGFSSLEHFGTTFKKYYGFSASEYRRKIYANP